MQNKIFYVIQLENGTFISEHFNYNVHKTGEWCTTHHLDDAKIWGTRDAVETFIALSEHLFSTPYEIKKIEIARTLIE